MALADMERNISFKGGWSQYKRGESMSYGMVPDSELKHDNMQPYFSVKRGYGSNDLATNDYSNQKRELFTGNLVSTWNPKKETRPHFQPVANMSYVYGTVWCRIL